MASPRRVALLASALLISALAGAPLFAQAPHISKPRPAPPTPPKIAPLTPAVIDNTLAIGGDELKAREVDTRLSVEVVASLAKGSSAYADDVSLIRN